MDVLGALLDTVRSGGRMFLSEIPAIVASASFGLLLSSPAVILGLHLPRWCIARRNPTPASCPSPSCKAAQDLRINFICAQCSRPIIAFRWSDVVIACAAIVLTGYLFGWFATPWPISLYVLTWATGIPLVLLRSYPEIQLRHVLHFLLTALALLPFLGHHGPSTLGQTFVGGLFVLLAVETFREWNTARSKTRTPWWDTLSVLSLLAFLLCYLLVLALRPIAATEPAGGTAMRAVAALLLLLERHLQVRLFLLTIAALSALFSALVTAVRSEFRAPARRELRSPKLTRIQPSRLPLYLRAVAPVLNLMVDVATGLLEAGRMLLVVTLLATEYVIAFLVNYARGLLTVLKTGLALLRETLVGLLISTAIPLVLAALLVIQAYAFSVTVFSYNLGGLGAVTLVGTMIGTVVGLLATVTLLVWLTTGESVYQVSPRAKTGPTAWTRLIDVAVSVVSSVLWLVFVLSICVLMSSLILWLLAHLVPGLPFGSLGSFTLGYLLLILVVLTLVYRFAQERA